MRTLIISEEYSTNNMSRFFEDNASLEFIFYDGKSDPFEIITKTINYNPSLLVLDDDFAAPNSVEIIKSIKDINKKIAIIFVTSNDSIELGREVSPLGIQFYAIKPLTNNELVDSIKSIIKLQEKNSY